MYCSNARKLLISRYQHRILVQQTIFSRFSVIQRYPKLRIIRKYELAVRIICKALKHFQIYYPLIRSQYHSTLLVDEQMFGLTFEKATNEKSMSPKPFSVFWRFSMILCVFRCFLAIFSVLQCIFVIFSVFRCFSVFFGHFQCFSVVLSVFQCVSVFFGIVLYLPVFSVFFSKFLRSFSGYLLLNLFSSDADKIMKTMSKGNYVATYVRRPLVEFR